jgi:hypothetical protein
MKMRWGALSILFLLAAIAAALLVRAAPPATQPSPLQYHEEVRANPPLHLHVVTVDLTDSRVSIRVVKSGDDPDGDGPWQTKIDTVSNVATREHLAAAVNGSFFSCKDAVSMLGRKVPYYIGNWGRASGWTMSDGVLWSNELALASMVIDNKGKISIGRFANIPPDARQMVSSGELLLVHGKNVATSKDIAPRTAIGVDRDGKRMVMFVVDGRRDDYSAGLTAPQVADELTKLGCYDAMLLDGGGSSTMVFRDDPSQAPRLVSRPSDGHDLPISLSVERPVADVVGVVVDDSKK